MYVFWNEMLNFVCFWILYKWHNVCLHLWLAFFNLVFLENHSFLLLCSIVWIDCNLPILLLMAIWSCWFVFVFAIANSAAMNILYLGVILLAHMVWIFSSLQDNAKLYSAVAEPVYTPTSSMWVTFVLHHLKHFLVSYF